jgi:hypothetical protein
MISDVKSALCRPKAGDQVVVRATIGNGQPGGWAMRLAGNVVGSGSEPEDVVLGTGAALDGKTLEISATMKAVVGGASRLSLLADLTAAGSAVDGAPIMIDDPAQLGDSAGYSIIVFFQAVS